MGVGAASIFLDKLLYFAYGYCAPIFECGAIFMPPVSRRNTMNVLDIQHLKVSIGIRDLLAIKNLRVQAGQKIGLIGKNGSGKTTLFRALLSEIEADMKEVAINGTIEMLPQLKQTNTTKSGGEVSQDYIVQVLSKSPGILLADEPTTNLDAGHIEWVEKKLNAFQGTILLVSHDRTLLDHVCDTIWELEEGQITEYSGNYSDYVQQKQNQRKHQQKEYEKFKQKEQQLEQAISQKKEQANSATSKPKKLSNSEARGLGVQTYYAGQQKKLNQNAKALQTRLDKLEAVEQPKDEAPIKMTLPNTRAFKNKVIIRAEKVTGEVGDKKLWDPSTFFIKGGDKVGIIGPNGSGKTTFLKKILNQSDESLYVSPAAKIGYFAQNMDILDISKTIIENVKDQSKQSETLIRTVLARLGFYEEDVKKKISVLSGGERVKVSLAKLFVSDSNTLILDEPTNYLDIYALEALEKLLKDYEGTLLVVSHDRQFISEVATKLLVFEEKQLTLFEGSYEEYSNRDAPRERDMEAERLMQVEMEITSILGQLSEPLLTDEEKEQLDLHFQELLKEKSRLKDE